MSSLSGDFVIVDDHDSSISYLNQSLWVQVSSPGGVDAIAGTVSEGLTGAKASFTFSGTAIQVVGIVASSVPPGSNGTPPSVQFSVDGQPTVVQPPEPSVSGTSAQEQSYSYFVQENLSGDSHTIDMDVLSASEEYRFVLDALVFKPSNTSLSPSESLVSTSIPAPTGGSGSSSSSTAAAPVGAIVGGIIGGLAVLIAAGVAIYFLCFRKRNRRPYFYAASANPGDLLEQETKPTPFEAPPPSVVPPSSVGGGSQYQPEGQSAYTASLSYPPGISTALSAHSASVSDGPVSDYSASSSGAQSDSSRLHLVGGSVRPVRASPNQSHSKAAEAGLLSVGEGQTTFHADSGIRFGSNGEPSSSSANVPTEVPPSYSEK